MSGAEGNATRARDDSDNSSQRSVRQRRRESRQLLTQATSGSPPPYAQPVLSPPHHSASPNDGSDPETNPAQSTSRQRRRQSVQPLNHIVHAAPAQLAPHTTVRPRILFYHRHDAHYGFTNFSPHPVMYQGKKYPTSEHLFQSFKVTYIYIETPLVQLIEPHTVSRPSPGTR